MRESLGGSLLLNLVIIFAGLVIVFFISILSYSKAYRVKNRIIEIIEKYEDYNGSVVNELNSDLKNAGYSAASASRCDSIKEDLVSGSNAKYDEKLEGNLNSYGYNYCVFKNDVSNGKYYVVVTFIHFEVPIIGDVLTFPVYGETKILGKDYSY